MPFLGGRHDRAESLAIAAYRLQRALLTGTTVPGRGGQGGSVSLFSLREDFVREVSAVAPGVLRERGYTLPPATPEQVVVDGGGDELRRLLDSMRLENERQAQLLTKANGPDGYLRRIERITDDSRRAEEFDKAGAKLAATASRIARNGARGSQEILRSKDIKALGYARVCTHPELEGHPCAFCAMLMSREYTYDSKRSAEGATGRRGTRRRGEAYHDNCDCVAETIFDDRQWQDPRFDRNRLYGDEWFEVTKTAKDAQEARLLWRRYHEGRRKAQAA